MSCGHRDTIPKGKRPKPKRYHRQSVVRYQGTRVRAQSSFGGSCRASPDLQQVSTFRATSLALSLPPGHQHFHSRCQVYRPSHRDANRRCHGGQKRRKHDQSGGRGRDVDRAF